MRCWLRAMRPLKRQVPRLRDWNEITNALDILENSILKRQVPRLRDWNADFRTSSGDRFCPWNDKYLDYEIETTCISLMREVGTLAWNDKYLDYEIETSTALMLLTVGNAYLKRQVPRLRDWNNTNTTATTETVALETTSTSITRLKLRLRIAKT